MDVDAERNEIQDRIAFFKSYMDHPLTRELLGQLDEAQKTLTAIVCDREIVDVPTFFAHFAAVGELRMARRPRAILETNIAELQARLKEIEPV